MKPLSFEIRLAVLFVGAAAALIWLVVASGAQPGPTLRELLQFTWGGPSQAMRTIREMVPLLLAGLAVYIALRAGLFNIGVEGQLTVGAMCAAAAALAVPNGFGLILAVLAGMVGGATWALPAGLIRAYRGGHEVISTIMLNHIAAQFTLIMLKGPLKDPSRDATTTSAIAEATRIPPLLSMRDPARPASVLFELSWVVPIALLVLIAFAIWLRRTVGGFELRLVGDNPRAAEFAGIDVKLSLVKAMMASGSVAGLTGAMLVLAYEHRFYDSISSGYGFDALGVALLAGGNPLGALASSAIFGTLNRGGSALQMQGIAKGSTFVVLGLLIIAVAAVHARSKFRREA